MGSRMRQHGLLYRLARSLLFWTTSQRAVEILGWMSSKLPEVFSPKPQILPSATAESNIFRGLSY